MSEPEITFKENERGLVILETIGKQYVKMLELQAERDEARAEVERLRQEWEAGEAEYQQQLQRYVSSDDSAVNGWFELTYAQYLTIPRSLLEAMPAEWQERFVRCLEELDETFDWCPDQGRYWVRLKDDAGALRGRSAAGVSATGLRASGAATEGEVSELEEEFRKIGMPGHLYLELFGSLVWDYFETPPYLVGSALTNENPRDVDVRLILERSEYERFCGPYVVPERTNARWVALCMAFSELGRKLTGLPIDFQIQRQDKANELFPGKREALGLVSHRIAR